MESVEIFVRKENTVEISPEWIGIVQQLADGKNISEITTRKQLSKRTLETKIQLIKYTLGCKTLSHLTALFLRKKLIK